MTDSIDDLRRLLVRDLEALGRELELFPEDAMLWRTLPGVTNSAGNLTLHLCGNLQYFIGSVLGLSGYVRNRDAEFSRRDVPRSELAADVRATIAAVTDTLGRQPPLDLDAVYPAAPNRIQVSTHRFLVHLATHLTYHLGQLNYLRRVLSGSTTSGGAVSIPGLV